MRATVIVFIFLGTFLLVTAPGGRREKPGKCPPNKYLGVCVQVGSADHGCSNDYQCNGDFKCCQRGCFYKCVAPEHDSSEEKHGKCPGSPARPYMFSSCEHNNEQSCSNDGECSGTKKCCQTYCTSKCTEPGYQRSGICPENSRSCNGYMKYNCYFDTECHEDEKCCVNQCELSCTKVQVPQPKKGMCPGAPERPYNCRYSTDITECDSDSDCPGSKKCCPSYCDMVCTEPERPKGTCPKRDTSDSSSESCDRSVGNKCLFDTDCDKDEKCCLTRCRRRCVSD